MYDVGKMQVKFWAKYRENEGKIQAKCCQNVCKILAKYWQNVGQKLGKFRENVGKLQAKYWKSISKMLSKCRENISKMFNIFFISQMQIMFIELLSFMYPKISLI